MTMKKAIILMVIMLGAYTHGISQPFGLPPEAVWSIFNENVRNNDFEGALPFGRWLVFNKPKTLEGYPQYRGDRNFDRMIRVYEHMAEKQTDPALKSAYLDSVLYLYNNALETFTQDEIDHFSWKRNQARFMQANADNIQSANEKAVEIYMELFDKNTERFVQEADGWYVNFVARAHMSTDREMTLGILQKAEPYASPALRDQFDEIRNELFRNPAERIVYLEERLETRQDDLELLDELMNLYERTGNRSKVQETAARLYELNPSYHNVIRMAEAAKSNAEYRNAIRYFNEAISKTDNADNLKRAHIEIANNYLNLGEFQRARDHARRASQIDPNWGEPYVKIAEIYGQTITDCAGGTLERIDKVVYWLVLDYLDRARSADRNYANTVAQMYRSYQPVTPTVEEKFYQGWNVGDTIRVDSSLRDCYGWIAESTTVR
jgi:tetratricopeptide (TPR) repeat protein